jgi:ribulose-phosphate 3-epimerase
MNYAPIVPAIIPKSESEVILQAERLGFSNEFQLDLVDGKFVNAISWPYFPVGDPMAVKQYLDRYTLEVDLMVSDPLVSASKWIMAGADMLVFHVESISLQDFKNFAKSTNVSVGVSAHGETTLDTLASYVEYADYIQLMGIYEVGSQGQPFDESVLDDIQRLKKLFPKHSITIDGSVNQNTIQRLREAGADRFICGSAIVLQEDPLSAWQALSSLIND